MNDPLQPVPEDWERCLAVVAHPDDLEFGASCALARWSRQGKAVVEVLATHGEAGIDGMEPTETARVRTEEQLASGAVVGASEVVFLDHRDGMLQPGLDLRRDIARAIRQHRPDVLVTLSFREGFRGAPRSWNHIDHRVLGEATVDAVRDAANRWVFPELRDEGHEPWSGVRFVLVASSPLSDHYVDVTDSLDVGIASLQAHRAYMAGLGGSFEAEPFLRGLAEPIGQEVGVGAAIAFELIPT
ncbi:MAG: PIG-L deacetylase family protein [Acidimicrobiales bacterium]